MKAKIAHPVRVCQYCGSSDLFEVTCEFGPQHARLGCLNCHRHIGWVKPPMTLVEARAKRMPFGPYFSKTLGSIANSPEGKRYLVRIQPLCRSYDLAAAIQVILDDAGPNLFNWGTA